MEDFKAKFNYPKVVDDSSCTVTCPVTQVGHSVVYTMLQRKVASYRDDNLCKCVCVCQELIFSYFLCRLKINYMTGYKLCVYSLAWCSGEH